MKRIKLMLCVAFLAVASYTGYTVYEKITMTDVEKFMLENLEALTLDEEGGAVTKDCYRVIVPSNVNDKIIWCYDCQVHQGYKAHSDKSTCLKYN